MCFVALKSLYIFWVTKKIIETKFKIGPIRSQKTNYFHDNVDLHVIVRACSLPEDNYFRFVICLYTVYCLVQPCLVCLMLIMFIQYLVGYIYTT